MPSDPFAAAAEAMFQAPGSSGALYRPTYGMPFGIRVIRSTGHTDMMVGGRELNAGSTLMQLLKSGFAGREEPKRGEGLMIDDAEWVLIGEPLLDVEGVSWMAEAAPA